MSDLSLLLDALNDVPTLEAEVKAIATAIGAQEGGVQKLQTIVSNAGKILDTAAGVLADIQGGPTAGTGTTGTISASDGSATDPSSGAQFPTAS